MKKLGFIGMGNMGSAIVKGAVSSGFIQGEDMMAFDLDTNKLQAMQDSTGIVPAPSIEALIHQCEMILLAIKPIHVENVLWEHRDQLKNKALLSIAAGWQYKRFKDCLDDSTRVCAIMPNTPAMVGAGMAIIEETNSLKAEELEFTKLLFEALGEVEILSTEMMAVGGTLSGCAPAWIFMAIEALADGAVYYGLPRKIAYKLAAQTVLGSGKMVLETGEHPGKLKDDVCSPGGITIRGVKALEEGNLRNIMMNAMRDAFVK